MGKERTFRSRLRRWYAKNRRELPWRNTRDPYRIWVSEVMLQQTRVAAVVPYYERFLEKFPDVETLARAPGEELLAAWSGLGYYSRARNLREAARRVVERGGFPEDYEGLLSLPGVGGYTAAAVGSMAFGLSRAVVDGNVLRVMSRLTNDPGDTGAARTRRRLADEARRLLDQSDPGEYNQAIMELGAVVCLPKQPLCPQCPVSADCEALAAGTERELPVKLRREKAHRIEKTVAIGVRRGSVLLRLRPARSRKLAGFWELPEADEIGREKLGEELGSFRHSITNHNYRFRVFRAAVNRAPAGFRWIGRERLPEMPLSTVAKKALRLLKDWS